MARTRFDESGYDDDQKLYGTDDPTLDDFTSAMRDTDIQVSKDGGAKRNSEQGHKLKRITSSVIANQDKHGKKTWASILLMHPSFENGALILIVINAVWIGIDIDWNGRGGKYLTPKFFQMGESAFCTLFLLELMVRILAYRRTEMFFYDPDMRKWNIFDLGLVFFMVMDTWVLAYVIKSDSQELQLLSTFRLIRLMRMTRMLRLVPELGMMVKSMVAAIRSVTSTMVLALGIMYIFAILFTQWTKSYGSQGKCIGPEEALCLQEYFGRIASSFLTLFQILVFDDTFEIIRPVFAETSLMGAMLIVYILFVSFTVLNMLIGIICDIVSETTAAEKEKQLQKRIEEIFMDMDTDESGTLTRDEFETSDALMALEAIGIEGHICKNAFDILDSNRDGCLASHEFVRMIFKCLHPPHAEEILELEARVDKIADVVGLGRRAIAVLDKEHKPKKNFKGEKGKPQLFEDMAARSPWMASVEAAAEKATIKHEKAKQAIEDKAMDEAEYSARLRSLGWKLGDVLLLAESGHLAAPGTVPKAGMSGGAPSGMLMIGDGSASAGPASWKQPGSSSNRPAPPMPASGLMTILRPALRALDARLHALRAECKAANMKLAGNISGGRGEDLVSRQTLQPLDTLITEVIQRLSVASTALRPPGAPAPLPSTEKLRQRDFVQLDEPRSRSARPPPAAWAPPPGKGSKGLADSRPAAITAPDEAPEWRMSRIMPQGALQDTNSSLSQLSV
jgi:voltage-gated sodium channel